MSRRPAQPVRRSERPLPASPAPPAPTPVQKPVQRPAQQPAQKPVQKPAQKPVAKTPGARASGASVVAFAARARARRRPSLRAVVAGVATVAVLLGLAWVMLASPLLTVREVGVTGTERLDPAHVRAALEPELGTPLARLDTGDLAERVEALPLVATADVLRSWPDGVEVRVVERQPVAVVAGPAGVTLVDGEGRRLMDAAEAPADLPELTPATDRAGADAVGAAVAVLEQMPPELRAQVATTDARTADSVTLTLRTGQTVVWGGASQSQQKAEVLAVLLTQEADVYDVSAPRTPVLR